MKSDSHPLVTPIKLFLKIMCLQFCILRSVLWGRWLSSSGLWWSVLGQSLDLVVPLRAWLHRDAVDAVAMTAWEQAGSVLWFSPVLPWGSALAQWCVAACIAAARLQEVREVECQMEKSTDPLECAGSWRCGQSHGHGVQCYLVYCTWRAETSCSQRVLFCHCGICHVGVIISLLFSIEEVDPKCT